LDIDFLVALPTAQKFVALRQTFVRRCHGGYGSSWSCGVIAFG
jgi:hypothetical protein